MKKLSKEIIHLFWTQFYGALNDNLFKSALVILITYKSISLFGVDPASMVALCGGIFILPFFLVSATSGQLADKFDKVWLTYRIKEAEVIIAILGVAGLFLENYYLMLFVLFLLGLQSTFFGPIKYSLIPRFTNENNLVYANALVSSGTFVAILVGTILGGVVTSFVGSGTWFFVALLLGVSLIGLYHARRLPLDTQAEREIVKVDWNFFTSTRDILKISYENKKIFVLVLGLSWFWFLGAGLLSLLPLVAKDIFNGTEAVATLMLFLFTLGMGIGPFVLEKLSKGKIVRFIIPVSLLLMSMVIFDLSALLQKAARLSFVDSAVAPYTIDSFLDLRYSFRFMFDLFFLSFFGGMFTVPQFAELQSVSKPEELSRIVAGNNVINSGAMVLVSVLIMVFHQMKFSLSMIFGIIGFLNLLVCVGLLYFYRNEFKRFIKF